MKDKLRELAERWKRYDSLRMCAGELLAILDAEGDGRAVACEAMRLLIAIREDDYLSDSSRHRIDTLRNAQPARSGVVSDEDVDAACVVYDNKTDMRADYPDIGAMRAALEHFARRTP